MPGRSHTSGTGYRYGFNGKENDNEVKGNGNQQDYGMRVYDTRFSRFLSIDPLAKDFAWNSVYAFAENDVIRSVDLDGLEKVSLSGNGNGQNYTQSNANAFYSRAIKMKSFGYNVSSVTTGKEIISTLKNETSNSGFISRIIHFSHGGYNGIFLNSDEGLYLTGISYGGMSEQTISDLVNAVNSGDVKFSKDALWIMGSCNASYNGGTEGDFAYDATKSLGITTISATGYVYPEINQGKETGKLKTSGTFLKMKSVFDVTYEIDGESRTFTFKTKSEAEAYNVGFNNDNAYKFEIKERVEQTDLGNTIEPSQY